jgi:sensor histidine kinase YesM
VGLFWLDELSFYVYGSAIDVLDFIIGMSFLLLNLSFVDCPRLQKISIIMVAGLISTLSSYPSFFVFSCVAFFVLSFMYFKQISFFLIALVFATLLATSVDTFNLLDAYIKNVSSLVVRSFLYQLDYFALSLFALYLVKLCFGEWRARGLQNNKLLLQQKNFEIQLIQKHIQPHFLMNALMSVQQQIENSPSDAIEMIDLLSRDFQLLHKQMGKTLIPLNDEIAICEGLCGLMGKSQVAHYSLALSGHDLPIEIPPGLLFTLIENGIKHGYSGRKDGQFFITISIKNKVLSIFVENDGLSKKVTNSNGGFGLHYIREQLDFWKPKQWSFEAGPSDLGWKNAIKITHFDNSFLQ